MGKNNNLINTLRLLAATNRKVAKEEMRQEAIDKASDEMTPVIYAAVALALHRVYGYGFSRIDKVFKESERIWEEHVGDPQHMIELCEKETGICVTFRQDGSGDDSDMC